MIRRRHLHRSRIAFSARACGSQGFSLLELLLVVAITVVLTAFASFGIAAALKQARTANAAQLISNQLRTVHQNAMDNRTEYVVTFQVPGRMLVQKIRNATLSTDTTVDLPGDEQFIAINGLPGLGKAPDNFGNGKTAIDFDQAVGGGSNVLYFYPDGTVLDAVGNPNNGVLYIAHPGDISSSRAITVWGATGRVKSFKLISVSGVSQWM